MVQQTADKLGGMIKNWLADEAGNATVDWVVATAGAVAMTIAVMIAIGGGVETFGEDTETELATRDVGYN